MPLTMHLDDDRQIADLRISGRVSWEESHRIAPELEDFARTHDKFRLLQVVEKFEGLDPHLLWDGLKFDRSIVPHISHCAIVGDMGWLAPLERAKEALLPMEMRLYSLRMEAMARMWVDRAGRGKTHVVGHAPRKLRVDRMHVGFGGRSGHR